MAIRDTKEFDLNRIKQEMNISQRTIDDLSTDDREELEKIYKDYQNKRFRSFD